jgi:hypothetical protein
MMPRTLGTESATARRQTRRHRDLTPARGIARGVLLGLLLWAVLAALWLI